MDAGRHEVYRRPPWAIFREGGSWVYEGFTGEGEDASLHAVAVFDDDHSAGDLYSPAHVAEWWRAGGLGSLTLMPSDQIVVARLVADREACLLHSAGVVVDGQGFVFVGHSDAGKSTTVELLRRGFGPRLEILCDDRTVVRRWPEGFRVHGTWSHGDVPDVSPGGAPLRAVLFLEQSGENALLPLEESRGGVATAAGDHHQGARDPRVVAQGDGRAGASRRRGALLPDALRPQRGHRVRARGPPVSDYVRRVGGALPGPVPRLANLDIELTERCDNDCIHCCINLAAGDAEARAREMTTAEVQGLLDQAADLGCLQVRFTGGEPLLRPDFERLYLHARRLGMKVLLLTNARRLGVGGAEGAGERLADLLARVPPLAPVEVSVYGMHAESYEAVSQRPGSFAHFRLGVERLLERHVPVLVKSALLPPNRPEMAELETWARETVGMTQPVTYAMAFDLRQRRDGPAKDVPIAALRVPPDEIACVLSRDRDAWRAAMRDVAARLLGPPGDALFACGASCARGRSVSVDAYGRVQPCAYVRTPDLTVDVVGRDGRAPATLAEAVDRFTYLGELRARDPEYLHRCARCFLKGLCEQCPAKSWTEHGTLDTPVEYLCAVTHAQARLAGWLEEDEVGWNCPEWRGRVNAV